MFFSIIIVNYNTKTLLKNCLNSIFVNCQLNDFEVIVVDNDSRDGSIEMLDKNFKDKVKIIANKENIGFGPANNQGAQIAKGEYLFFLNSDTIIKDDILTLIKNFLETNSQVGIVSPCLLLENGTKQEFAFGNFPTLFNSVFRKIDIKNTNNNKPREVDWVSGAALIIRKNIFKKVGGFDENFFMYFEDVDLCKRVWDLGYKIMILPQFFLVHLGGKSIDIDRQRKKYYYTSQDYFYKKHYGYLVMYLMKFARWFFIILYRSR